MDTDTDRYATITTDDGSPYGTGTGQLQQTAATNEAIQFDQSGEQAFRAGQYAAAAYNWRHALVDDPSNGTLAMMLAQALFAKPRITRRPRRRNWAWLYCRPNSGAWLSRIIASCIRTMRPTRPSYERPSRRTTSRMIPQLISCLASITIFLATHNRRRKRPRRPCNCCRRINSRSGCSTTFAVPRRFPLHRLPQCRNYRRRESDATNEHRGNSRSTTKQLTISAHRSC